MSDVSLVTGFPSFLSQCVARRLLETDPREQIFLLCQGRFQVAAQIFVHELPRHARERVEVLLGDAQDMDLGLAGADYRRLREHLTVIHHLTFQGAESAEPRPPQTGIQRGGARQRSGGEAEREHAVHKSTRHILYLAQEAGRLRRLCHYSSAMVAGNRTGVVLEDELIGGQRFSDEQSEALFRAEQMVQRAISAKQLPATVFRPSHIVGDSRTGEIDSFTGPYLLIENILASPLPVEQLLPVPGIGSAPINLVPIDFVVEAAVLLSRDPRAAQITCHLTDPCPFSARAVGDLLARSAQLAPRRVNVPPRLLRAVLRAPGIERFTRLPMAAIEETLGQLIFFNCVNTLRLLEGTGLRCPPVVSYLDSLVHYMQQAKRRREVDEDADPLE